MNTYLGARAAFGPDEVDEALVARRRGDLPGGLSVRPAGGAGGLPARSGSGACAAGRSVALSLSDRVLRRRHRAAFRALVADHVDILFANEAEIRAVRARYFEAAAAALGQPGRGAGGADPQRGRRR